MAKKALSMAKVKDICYIGFIKRDGTLYFADKESKRIFLSDGDDKIIIYDARDAFQFVYLLGQITGRSVNMTRDDNYAIWKLV